MCFLATAHFGATSSCMLHCCIIPRLDAEFLAPHLCVRADVNIQSPKEHWDYKDFVPEFG